MDSVLVVKYEKVKNRLCFYKDKALLRKQTHEQKSFNILLSILNVDLNFESTIFLKCNLTVEHRI